MYESEDRMVSHPDHYISETGIGENPLVHTASD